MEKKKKRDLLIRHPENANAVIRVKATGEVSIGKLEKPAEGEPISNEVIAVHETPMSPMVNECETIFDPDEYAVSSEGGPPKVNSDSYRSNWERIFGKPDDALLN